MSDTPVAAALAVVIREDSVLLVRRFSDKPDAGLWGFPGGRIEARETSAAAALRELAEETGLHATEAVPLGSLRFDALGVSYHLHAFLCPDPGGTFRAADDAEEARFFPCARVISGRLLMSRDVDRLCLRATHRLRGDLRAG